MNSVLEAEHLYVSKRNVNIEKKEARTTRAEVCITLYFQGICLQGKCETYEMNP